MKIINLEKFIKHKKTREWVEALIFALIIASAFRVWFYAPFRVPTGSMIHTIEIGDHLFADMHAYGFRVPFTESKLAAEAVKRGDIIIFPNPENPDIDFIKRAIAIGGDTVELRGEQVFVNGKPEKADHVFYHPQMEPVQVFATFKVPEGKIWAMGDNRRNSRDSRFWGFVDEKTVMGKGLILYWSHDPNQSLFSGYRFDRIAKMLE